MSDMEKETLLRLRRGKIITLTSIQLFRREIKEDKLLGSILRRKLERKTGLADYKY